MMKQEGKKLKDFPFKFTLFHHILYYDGPILSHVKNEDGTRLVKGKKVTGFSNTEETQVGLTEVVPILVEDMLIENGAFYSNADAWQAYAIQDGNLITGQNPASSELVAEKLLESLK